MKKFVYVLILGILISASCNGNCYAEEYTPDEVNCLTTKPEELFKGEYRFYGRLCFDKKTGQGITGIVKKVREDGTIDEEAPYKDGRIDGKWKVYYENGQIAVSEEFKNGKLDGEITRYDETGKILETNFYVEVIK